MRKIDTTTGEITSVEIKGLWAHFPIPAYQVLGRQKEWQAQRVLSCLVSYLGDSGLAVWPSYDAISKRCGISRNGIRPALKVLEENGFIKIGHWNEGKKERNKYYFQPCCWDTSCMNSIASKFLTPTSKCLDCRELIDRGSYGLELGGRKVHWGCGGTVVSLETINRVSRMNGGITLLSD